MVSFSNFGDMTMSQGTIVQCIGAVVDIQFPRDAMPKVYDALQLESAAGSFAEEGLTFEVQQQLGDGVVRYCTGLHRRSAPRYASEGHRCSDLCTSRSRNTGSYHGRAGPSD